MHCKCCRLWLSVQPFSEKAHTEADPDKQRMLQGIVVSGLVWCVCVSGLVWVGVCVCACVLTIICIAATTGQGQCSAGGGEGGEGRGGGSD